MGLLVVFNPCPGQIQPAAAGNGNVRVVVDAFGLGNITSPGKWNGLKLHLEYAGSDPIPVIVAWRLIDADGDRVLARRDLTLNPGKIRAATTWLYAYLSPKINSSAVSYIEVYQALEPTNGSRRTRRGRLLAAMPVSPKNVAEASSDLIAVLGPRDYGLTQYSTRITQYDETSPTSYVYTRIAANLSPDDLPDRWMGLAPFSTLVWGSQSSISPARLSDEQAMAVRRWVQRGGHLVIVLPRIAGVWTSHSGENPLDDLLPSPSEVTVRLVEDVPLSPLRLVLTNDRKAVDPVGRIDLHIFSGSGLQQPQPGKAVAAAETVPLMVDQQNRPFVVQRTFGTGRVTLIGIDLAHPTLLTYGLPLADTFWNRLLGRRAHALSYRELEELRKTKAAIALTKTREVKWLDKNIPGSISQSGSSARGLVLAVLVFGLYWLIAGPGLWGYLKIKKLSRHAWAGFVLTAAFFTLISWGGAVMLKPGRIPTKHFTFLTAVSGQKVQQATTFFSALLPDYGNALFRVGREGEEHFHDALWSFYHPEDSGQTFRDARTYEIQAAAPSHADVPSRSTSKQMSARWLGPVGKPWGLPYTPDFIEVTNPDDPDRTSLLNGIIKHNLPRAPARVVVIYIKGLKPYAQRDRARPPGAPAAPFVEGWAWVYKNKWEPGKSLDLAQVTSLPFDTDAMIDSYLGSIRNQKRWMEAVSLLQQIEPPNYGVLDTVLRNNNTYKTRLLAGQDISGWFARPCVIVLAEINDSPMPTPLYINDAAEESRGTTFLRWIYPLPHAPRMPVP